MPAPLAARAAKAYVAGERLEDALRVADKLSERGLGVTLGYWDSPKDTPRIVADAYLDAIDAVADRQHAYVSIKAPALDFSHELSAEVVDRAALRRVRVHFDALGPEMADRSRTLFDHLLDRGAELSYTLPGCWLRSVSDAAWAAERRIVVRVVKGQWADPADPLRDLRRGYLEVIDALAARAAHVAVASHDTQLVAAAVARLKGARLLMNSNCCTGYRCGSRWPRPMPCLWASTYTYLMARHICPTPFRGSAKTHACCGGCCEILLRRTDRKCVLPRRPELVLK